MRKALAACAVALVASVPMARAAAQTTVPPSTTVVVVADDNDDDEGKAGLWGLLGLGGLIGLAGLAGLRRRSEPAVTSTNRVQGDRTPRGSTSGGT